MRGGLISSEKLELLRQVTDSSFSSSHLRKVLIRCGGDVNAAAAVLLSEPEIACTSPKSKTRPHSESLTTHPDISLTNARKTSPSGRENRPISSAGTNKEPASSSADIHPIDSRIVPSVAQHVLPSNQAQAQQARRSAWRQFYLDHRTEAVHRVGPDKPAVDRYIACAWKQMGSAGRKTYIAKFVDSSNQKKLPGTKDNCDTSRGAQTNGTDSIVEGSATPINHDSVLVTPQKKSESSTDSPMRIKNSAAVLSDETNHAEQAIDANGSGEQNRDDLLDGADKTFHDIAKKKLGSNPCCSNALAVIETNQLLPKPSSRKPADVISVDDEASLVKLSSPGAKPRQESTIDNTCTADVSRPPTHESISIEKQPDLSALMQPEVVIVQRNEEINNGQSFNKRAEIVKGRLNWPQKLISRLCRGSMLTTGRNKLLAGDDLILEASRTAPGHTRGVRKLNTPKSAPQSQKVRFLKNGRELGLLAPEIGHALAPALQSGLVSASCKVVSAPIVARMLSEVILELTIYLEKAAFDGNGQEDKFEGGYTSVEKGSQDAEGAAKGVDSRRMKVVHMISSLGLCELPETDHVDLSGVDEKANDPGAVSEEGAEAYYRTVTAIDESDAKSFVPSKYLICNLREYQKVGVNWMISREKHGNLVRMNDSSNGFTMNPLWKKRLFPSGGFFFMNISTGALSLSPPPGAVGGPYGGILADEMGLGKTVQCIACIVHDVEERINVKDNIVEPNENSTEMGVLPKTYDSADDLDEGETESNNNLQAPQDLEVHDVALGNTVDAVSPVDEDSTRESDAATQEAPCALSIRPPPTRKIQKNNEFSGPASKCPTISKTERIKSCKRIRDSDEEWVPNDVDSDEACDRKSGASGDASGDSSSSDEVFVRPMKRHRNVKDSKMPDNVTLKESPAKTLMSKLSKKGSRKGGTLIVCPTSLVTQWMNELGTHVAPNFLRCVAHYGQGRGLANSISVEAADVVVTTYGTLTSEFSDAHSRSEHCGPIFKLKWRRIVLDEAHTIKSRLTRWAKAAYHVEAERRWCMTGTVIHNHVNDVFSLLHFLQVKPWSSWAFWNRGIVSNLESANVTAQKAAMSLVRDIVSSITLRRKKSTKDSKGNAIVQLKKKTVNIVYITPSQEEQDFYNALHKRTMLKFNAFQAQGQLLKNYASVFELLLRLRQACDHPYLVFAAPSKDVQLMKDRNKMYEAFMEGGSSTEFVEKVLSEAESGKLSEKCPICLDVIDDAVAPRECGHPACRACVTSLMQKTRKCPVCRVIISPDSITTLPRASRFAVDLKQKWRSSAKIDHLLKELLERRKLRISEKSAIGKSVIFSQFTSMLDLVEHALEKEKMLFLRIDGSVPQSKRANIVHRFDTEDELGVDAANILLVSLRAGGVGLNLVAASHAVLLDIHWNPQVDAQAQDRIHRYGQSRDVVIQRYVIEGSVEQRLLQVQARKQDLADGALDIATEEDKKQARLSELKLLFGS